jgi:hypothetical protein
MSLNVVLSPDEFASDLDLHLGRANGNIYQRNAGIEGVHDGQYMIRLIKKRFVILDYSIVPTEADMQAAAVNPHIIIPDGAGKNKCHSPECTKVGVPVCLYDSNPDETPPLYIRSGLCFTCQRHLNEKRRTERKSRSKSDGATADGARRASPPRKRGIDHVLTVATSKKKFKMGGSIVDLSPDAIIINGPVGGAKPAEPGYGYSEMGDDIAATLRDVVQSTNGLLAASGQTVPEVTFSGEGGSDTATAALAGDMSPQDISSLYESAFKSMSKGLYLLKEWKSSWDGAVAAAVAQETDSGFADAVASAAAVAAAADSQDNMASLLLAAGKKGDKGAKADEVVGV